MTLRNFGLAALCAAAVLNPFSAQAHFQLAYTPEVNLAKAGDVPVKLIFWHPFENGHVMDMGEPLQFYAVHRGEKIDLMDTLEPMTFSGKENAAAAYDAMLPVKRSGDYVLVVEPAPYYEESEDIFIQQITKSYVNRNEIPTDWMEPQGLATEILPLNRPTNIVAGSTFTGRVLAEGKPVAGAEIEIEYMAAEPDMAENKPLSPRASPMPGGAVVAISDDNGYFTFGIPKAGFWGFAALGSGPLKEHEGKELSQDAVIWVRAYDVE
jgi:cobalt/nickel transport protein